MNPLLPNDTFYPTPDALIDRMIDKIQGRPKTILEPSAGAGNIIKRMRQHRSMLENGYRDRYSRPYEHCQYSAIEIDPRLQAILDAECPGAALLDTDFLQYAGRDHFDLIIMNPPFDHGDLHLLKAIDIMYSGEIICLLNAETIRNPYTNSRRELAKRLADLNAEIEYIEEAFLEAERETAVEVALVYIKIERKVEEDLFAGVKDSEESCTDTAKQDWEVATRNKIRDMVADYDRTIVIGTKTILDFYKNYNKIGKYIGLDCEAKSRSFNRQDDLTDIVRYKVNDFIKKVRKDFWHRALGLKEVQRRMTSDKLKEFERQVSKREAMDFTENNIRQFIINLINGYESMLVSAVAKVFDKLTLEHCYSQGVVDENVHYFNGWKTNKAFKVNKKVIIPIGYCDAKGEGPFTYCTWGGKKWRANTWQICDITRDIDVVMSYFDASLEYVSIVDAVSLWLDRQISRGIDSSYFKIDCYKKGTMHLTFKSDDILRRFNVVACRAKGWLPMDYGTKRYAECTDEEQAVIREFEGAEQYDKYVNRALFATKPLTAIAA